MKKVFYFLNTVPEWIDVVKRLEENNQWKSLLWVTTETLQPAIKLNLPNTIIVDLQSHKRGEFNKKIYIKNTVLDKNIIEEYYNCEKIVLAMMNRMDPNRHNFNYHQRIQLYYRTLMYWIYTFEEYQPDLVFFDETPHVPFEYIMHEVALKKNIKIVRFNPIHINHRLLFFGEVNKTPSYIQDRYKSIKNENKEYLLSKDIEEYYLKLQGTYKEATPYYMKKQPIDFKKALSKALLIISRVLQNRSDSSYQRTKDSYIQNFKMMKFIKVYNRFQGRVYKKRLLREYNSLVSKNIDLSKKYIYLPLHFQPERTTSPDGDIYENQWLMIQLLAQTIPNGWRLYVKEHISQFRKDFSGEMGRNIEFYKEVLLFDNVELVPLECNSFDLIDNAQAVATISGTVGLEAISRDKRVLVFGYPWYEICEGVTKVINKEDIVLFFKKTLNSKINQKNVKAFFKTIDDISLSANHSGNIWSKDFDREKNIKNLLEMINLYADKID